MFCGEAEPFATGDWLVTAVVSALSWQLATANVEANSNLHKGGDVMWKTVFIFDTNLQPKQPDNRLKLIDN
jgi:hypothetical protein